MTGTHELMAYLVTHTHPLPDLNWYMCVYVAVCVCVVMWLLLLLMYMYVHSCKTGLPAAAAAPTAT